MNHQDQIELTEHNKNDLDKNVCLMFTPAQARETAKKMRSFMMETGTINENDLMLRSMDERGRDEG